MIDTPVILVIEDEPEVQAIVEDTLKEGGFEPAIAGSGEEAVTLLKAFKGKYRALVTDIHLLGRMDGWRVARAAREIDADFPVVYVTGFAGEQWRSQGVPNSILLTKPFSPERLTAAISKLLNGSS